MKEYVFLANDPGGYDAVYPVAVELSKEKNVSVKLILTGQAANKEPLFKMTDEEALFFLENKARKNDKFILVTGTSWNSFVELQSILLCKKSNIRTVSILDYWSNYSERFNLEGMYVFPDILFVMDQLAYDEAVQEGINPDIMRIVGHPGLDRFSKIKRKKRKILFLSQPLSMLYSVEEIGYSEFEAFDGVVKACNELGIVPYIKFHPKETEEMRSKYQSYSIDGVVEELAPDFDVVIGMATMGLLHCSLMGIPVLCYEPNLKTRDYSITNKLNITRKIYEYEELVKGLSDITGLVKEKSIPFWYDGHSTQRCLKELLNMWTYS